MKNLKTQDPWRYLMMKTFLFQKFSSGNTLDGKSIPRKFHRKIISLFLCTVMALGMVSGYLKINISAQTVDQLTWSENFEGKTNLFTDTAFWDNAGGNVLIHSKTEQVISGSSSLYYYNTSGWTNYIYTSSPSEFSLEPGTNYHLKFKIRQFTTELTDRFTFELKDINAADWLTYAHFIGDNTTGTMSIKDQKLTEGGSLHFEKTADKTWQADVRFTSDSVVRMLGFGMNGEGGVSLDDLAVYRVPQDGTEEQLVWSEDFEGKSNLFSETSFWDNAGGAVSIVTDEKALNGNNSMYYNNAGGWSTYTYTTSPVELAFEPATKYKLKYNIKQLSTDQTDRYTFEIKDINNPDWLTYAHYKGNNSTGETTVLDQKLTTGGAVSFQKTGDKTWAVEAVFTTDDKIRTLGFGINGAGAAVIDDIELYQVIDVVPSPETYDTPSAMAGTTVWSENFNAAADLFSDTAFWVRTGSPVITEDAAKEINGTKALYYENTDGGWNTFTSTSSPAELAIEKNTSYELRATIREFSTAETDRYYMQLESTAGGSWPAYIHWLGNNASDVVAKAVALPEGGSSEIVRIAENTYTVTLRFTSTDEELMIGFGMNGKGSMAVDDIILNKVGGETPPPPEPVKTGTSAGRLDVTCGETVLSEDFEGLDNAAADKGLDFFQKTSFWNNDASFSVVTDNPVSGTKMIGYQMGSDQDTTLFGSSSSELILEKGQKYIVTYKYRTDANTKKMIFEYRNDSTFGYWVHFDPNTYDVSNASPGAAYMIRSDLRGFSYATYIFEATLENSYLIFKAAGQNGEVYFDSVTVNKANSTTASYEEGFGALDLNAANKAENLYQNTDFWYAGQTLDFIGSPDSIDGNSIRFTAEGSGFHALLGSTHTKLVFSPASQSVISFKYKLTESENLSKLVFQVNKQGNGFTYWVHWDPKTLSAVDASPDAIYTMAEEDGVVTVSFLVRDFTEGDYLLLQTDGPATMVLDDFSVRKESANTIRWEELASDLATLNLITLNTTSNGGKGEVSGNGAVRGSLPYSGDWTEYMQTSNQTIALAAQHQYMLRFAYSIESPPAGNGFFTFFVKNPNGQPADDIYTGFDKNSAVAGNFSNKINAVRFTENAGKKYAEILFTNHNSTGSYFSFGIHNDPGTESGTASILISEISIWGIVGLGEDIIREENEIVIDRGEEGYSITDNIADFDQSGKGYQITSSGSTDEIRIDGSAEQNQSEGTDSGSNSNSGSQDESGIDSSESSSAGESSGTSSSGSADSSSIGSSQNAASSSHAESSGSSAGENGPGNMQILIWAVVVLAVVAVAGAVTYFIVRRRKNV